MKNVKFNSVCSIIAMISLMSLGPAIAYGAAENVGSVVALKGSALIERKVSERETRVKEAKVKDGIELKDTIQTKESSKAKMLFIDESVLTMGEKSKVVIREFVYSKDRGKSILNLIDGKMRSVVGRSEFEVHTPTAVAAARGTVFDCETGQTGGRPFTTCTSYEGLVDIRSIDPSITGKVTLQPGMTITVIGGQPLPAPIPAPTASAAVQAGTTTSGDTGAGPSTTLPVIIQSPPITNQSSPTPPPPPPPPPPPTTTPVNIGITFP